MNEGLKKRMKQYDVKIKLITPYLQAKFGEKAQASLKVKAGTKAKVEDDDMWKDFLYKDKKGIFIPSKQIRESLVNGAKGIKKKPYGSFKEIVQSYFFISPDKIYINKQKPDATNVSYPSRADGQRVKLVHPLFKEGLEVNFQLMISSDEIDESTIKLIIEKAGYEKGIGAWRAGGHGRYKLEEFKSIK